MNYTCYVVDDEPHATAVLVDYINRTPGLSLAGSHANPLAALAEMTQAPPALAFLDIDMAELSGIALAGMINQHSAVIFTTSFREYGAEAFEKNAAGYLLKPISYERFLACVQKIREPGSHRAEAEKTFFFIKTEAKGKMVRVPIPDITYIRSLGNYVEIYLGKEKLIAYLTLSELYEQLPPGKFSRIEKSFIVSHDHIQSIENFRAKLADGTALPIGRTYSAAFMEKMKRLLLVSKRTPGQD
ncbi:LytTR family DNA-binding domain-containing protein [Mucilaginibacter sp.]|uniref:LytR/AlgR family response regulator transcription factor n=1 Tax=Mucilaginibacter sp. TaxID=1882438 RepID=UPI003267D872